MRRTQNHFTMSTMTIADVLLKNFLSTPDARWMDVSGAKTGYPVDVFQKEDSLVVQIACVGASIDDLKISTADDILRIQYEKVKKSDEDLIVISKSIVRRPFDLGYRVPSKYDLGKIEAELSKGLLTITIPYKEQSKPREIKIKNLD